MGLDRDLGFSRGHQGRQGHRSHDDDDDDPPPSKAFLTSRQTILFDSYETPIRDFNLVQQVGMNKDF